MFTRIRWSLLVMTAVGVLGTASGVSVQTRSIDTESSTLTVFAYKSGLFSAFAHDHVIRATVARGSISEELPREVDLVIRAGDLKVLDPTLAANRRPEVQTRMLGPEVLDAATHPEITFSSTTIDATGAGGWNVSGRLTIRGRMREVTFLTLPQNGRYRGSVRIKQRDFGIDPISIVGGTVKVKDELKIEFDIAAR